MGNKGITPNAETHHKKSMTFNVSLPMSAEETQRLIHELRVHQIELEMQNEELRQAQAESNAHLQQYTDLYDSAPVGYCTIERDTKIILQANLTAARMLGYTRQELFGRQIAVLVAEDSRRQLHTMLTTLFIKKSHKKKEHCQLLMLRADEESFWVHIEASCSEDGRSCHLVLLDIEESKTLESKLHNEQVQTAELMNAVNAIVWEVDVPTFQFTYVSAAAERMLGYPCEQWIEEADFWQNHIHPDDRDESVEFCAVATKQMRNHDFEYRFFKADGCILHLRDIVTVICHDGKPATLKGVIIDITEERRVADELRSVEAYFRSAVNALAEGITIQDDNAKIIFCNPRAEEILGLSADQMSGRTSLDPRWQAIYEDGSPFPGEEHPAVQTLRTGKAQRNVVMGIPKPNGILTWLLVNSQPIQYAAPSGAAPSQASGVVVSFTDITEQKQMQQELNALNQTLEERVEERTRQLILLDNEKNEFLGIAAHDLKNPLSGILSSAELLNRYIPDNVSAHHLLTMIVNASHRMLDIISNVLDVNRIESGFVRLDIQALNLELLVGIVEQYQISAARKGIIIDFENPSNESYWVLADKQAVHQIFDNILSNAVKYSPQWKTIWVRVMRRTNDEGQVVIRVEVQNEGSGLSPDDKQRLFGKFARLSARPTGGEHSTGLGLSIVKKLVELQQGRVWCESELNEGATFIIELPSAQEAVL